MLLLFVMFMSNDSLSVIGGVTLLYLAAKLIYGSYQFIWMYFTKSALDYKSFGEWALVTGSTDGIGKGIAFELAQRGLNIVLASRNPEKLNSVAQEIEDNFNVKTKCITIDFSESDNVEEGDTTSSNYDAISDGIKGLEIGILVNNVGLGAFGDFLHPFSAFNERNGRNDHTTISQVIYCNDTSTARVTGIVLPQMLERRRGLVVNLSSLAATITMPNDAIYSSTKKFIDTFTKALHCEYKNRGIIFQSIQPSRIRTNMTGAEYNKANFLYPECKNYMEHLMQAMGKDIETTGYHSHGLLRAFITSLPEWVMSKIMLHSLK